MVTAVALEEVKERRSWHEIKNANGGGAAQTPFLGSRNEPDAPHATLNEPDAGLLSSAHFHKTDQFQVVVRGKGRFGKHDLSPYCVHFARAYTPYGPINSDAGDGLTFFVMRAHHDPGSQHLPKERSQLEQVADRQPWQVTRRAVFPASLSEDVLLQAMPEISDDRGLAAYTLSMKPGAEMRTPDPSHGDGQYLVILKGSLRLAHKECSALALAFIRPAEGSQAIRAGAAGLEALILNFPQPRPARVSQQTGAARRAGTWHCALCSFVYDEAAGLPDEGIAPGTRWEDVPESWICPDCSASKSDFQMAERGK